MVKVYYENFKILMDPNTESWILYAGKVAIMSSTELDDLLRGVRGILVQDGKLDKDDIMKIQNNLIDTVNSTLQK